jgi:hypothetical protein
MNPQQHILSMHTWVSLSNEQRNRIRHLFNIPRSSHVMVNDGVIETDGTTPEDFKQLTVYKMKAYLNSDSDDFHKLFDMVLAKVQDAIEGKPIVEPVPVVSEPVPVINANIKKNVKTKKNQ